MTHASWEDLSYEQAGCIIKETTSANDVDTGLAYRLALSQLSKGQAGIRPQRLVGVWRGLGPCWYHIPGWHTVLADKTKCRSGLRQVHECCFPSRLASPSAAVFLGHLTPHEPHSPVVWPLLGSRPACNHAVNSI